MTIRLLIFSLNIISISLCSMEPAPEKSLAMIPQLEMTQLASPNMQDTLKLLVTVDQKLQAFVTVKNERDELLKEKIFLLDHIQNQGKRNEDDKLQIQASLAQFSKNFDIFENTALKKLATVEKRASSLGRNIDTLKKSLPLSQKSMPVEEAVNQVANALKPIPEVRNFQLMNTQREKYIYTRQVTQELVEIAHSDYNIGVKAIFGMAILLHIPIGLTLDTTNFLLKPLNVQI